MKNLVSSLAVLIPCPNHVSFRAAAHLVAVEHIRANPIPSPAEMDAEMDALYSEYALSETPAPQFYSMLSR